MASHSFLETSLEKEDLKANPKVALPSRVVARIDSPKQHHRRNSDILHGSWQRRPWRTLGGDRSSGDRSRKSVPCLTSLRTSHSRRSSTQSHQGACLISHSRAFSNSVEHVISVSKDAPQMSACRNVQTLVASDPTIDMEEVLRRNVNVLAVTFARPCGAATFATPATTARLAQCCTALHQVFTEEGLWENICKERELSRINQGQSWRDIYVNFFYWQKQQVWLGDLEKELKGKSFAYRRTYDPPSLQKLRWLSTTVGPRVVDLFLARSGAAYNEISYAVEDGMLVEAASSFGWSMFLWTCAAAAATYTAGASAIVRGAKLAEKFNDDKYCLLGRFAPLADDQRSAESFIWLSNFLSEAIQVRILSSNTHGCSASSCSLAVVASASNEEEETVAESDVCGGENIKLHLPLAQQGSSERLTLSVVLKGKRFRKELGVCRAFRGWQYLVCKVDDDLRAAMAGRCPSGHMLLASCAGLNGHCCSVCGQHVRETTYRCTQCQFNLCKLCFEERVSGDDLFKSDKREQLTDVESFRQLMTQRSCVWRGEVPDSLSWRRELPRFQRREASTASKDLQTANADSELEPGARWSFCYASDSARAISKRVERLAPE